jgi:hypothetical protein
MKETWTHKDAEREAEEDGGKAEEEEGGAEDEGGALEAGDEDMVPSVRSTSTTTPAISASACTRKPEVVVSSSPEAASKPGEDAREEWPREEWPRETCHAVDGTRAPVEVEARQRARRVWQRCVDVLVRRQHAMA